MYKNSFVHVLTKITVDVMFYSGIICCIAVPFVLRLPMFSVHEGGSGPYYLFICAVLELCGVLCLYILWQLRKIFKTLSGGNPFVIENVNCLRKCGVASFIIALVFVIDFLNFMLITAFIMIVIFTVLGLFSLTLKDVFKQAIAYKEENDWTV